MLLVLDDHPIARQGLESIIRLHCPEHPVVQAGTVEEAKTAVQCNPICMAFVDITLKQESGFDFIEWVRQRHPDVDVFCITASSRKSDFLYAKSLNVDAYLLKDSFLDEIIFALKTVERGGKFYSASIIDVQNRDDGPEARVDKLSHREIEVLALLGYGCSNVEISSLLFISEGTTKKHIASIMAKLGLKNRVEAALFSSHCSVTRQVAAKFPVPYPLQTVFRRGAV